MKQIFKNGILLVIVIASVSFGVMSISSIMINWVQSWHLSAIGYLIIGIGCLVIGGSIFHVTNKPALSNHQLASVDAQ